MIEGHADLFGPAEFHGQRLDPFDDLLFLQQQGVDGEPRGELHPCLSVLGRDLDAREFVDQDRFDLGGQNPIGQSLFALGRRLERGPRRGGGDEVGRVLDRERAEMQEHIVERRVGGVHAVEAEPPPAPLLIVLFEHALRPLRRNALAFHILPHPRRQVGENPDLESAGDPLKEKMPGEPVVDDVVPLHLPQQRRADESDVFLLVAAEPAEQRRGFVNGPPQFELGNIKQLRGLQQHLARNAAVPEKRGGSFGHLAAAAEGAS